MSQPIGMIRYHGNFDGEIHGCVVEATEISRMEPMWDQKGESLVGTEIFLRNGETISARDNLESLVDQYADLIDARR